MPHSPRKRFGQNFLRDDSVIADIAKAMNPAGNDHVVEIGPGEGALTEALVSSECQLDAIELDRDLRTRLLAAFSTYPRFTLHSADALAFDFNDLIKPGQTLGLLATSPITSRRHSFLSYWIPPVSSQTCTSCYNLRS